MISIVIWVILIAIFCICCGAWLYLIDRGVEDLKKKIDIINQKLAEIEEVR